ncbi:hypothetical protein Micbo1qcDRAFT_193142 [Microdochium bolleyi]|uniref:Uncharacterized protein n=1 Tax=Microdochium bolleyi TaxID=196109 RepID=A0A136J9D6_9PEZI|nr:hypothetical protein Micbo1qcDRAFT_193142 [Microdochium bolleyi]
MSARTPPQDFVHTHYEETAELKRNAGSDRIKSDHSDDDIRKPVDRRGKRQKIKEHCGRFWCCWALFILITLSAGLPVLFMVILPALAQRIVNDTNLPIYGADLRPINGTHLKAGLSTGLSLPAGINIKLDACDLWLYRPEAADKPYARIPIPDQHVSGGGGASLAINDITGEVTDQVQIHEWMTRILNDDTTTISVRTTTTAWLGAIKIPLTIDKTVTTPALRALKGSGLTEARIYLPPQADGTNIAGTMVIPNHSIMTMDLGNVTLNAMSGDILIGKVLLQNALLKPGNQTLPFRGEIFLDRVLGNIVAIAASQAASIGKGLVTLTASGNSTVINGAHIGYMEDVLAKARIRVDVLLSQLLSDVLGSWTAGTLSVDTAFSAIWDGFVGSNSTLASIFSNLTQGQDGTPGGLLSEIIGNWNLTSRPHEAEADMQSFDEALNKARAFGKAAVAV